MRKFFEVTAILLAIFSTDLCAQSSSPFTEINPEARAGRDLPESVPPDLVDPVVSSRKTNADKIARLFNRKLRDIEEEQSLIFEELDTLPISNRETPRSNAFGYHSGNTKQRPKWIQIDLGRRQEPDAIALFPVTAEVDGQTVFGYGFPRAFRIDISDDPEFRAYETMAEGRSEDPKASRRWPYFKIVGGLAGRYIRVSATESWRRSGGPSSNAAFALAEVMVIKGDRNLALNRPVKGLDRTNSSRDLWRPEFVTDGITNLGIPHGSERSESLGFRASSKGGVAKSWVQIDLEESMPIQEVRLVLADSPEVVPDPTVRFPYPITIEISDSPDMRRADVVGRFSPTQIGYIGNNLLSIPVDDGYGRYVRLSVSDPKKKGPLSFALAEMLVFSENRNVAFGKPVRALHPQRNASWKPEYLVDGFSSRAKLATYQDWLGNIDRRNDLMRKWVSLENQRVDLGDSTFTQFLLWLGAGIAGVFGFVLLALSRGRVRRRKDLEDLRQRIASDLHDDIGSNLSSIALLAELGKTETDEPELVLEELTEIKSTADKTIESMRDIVWLIRPDEESWKEMLTRFRETAAKLLRAHEYEFEVTGKVNDDRLPLEFKRDFFLIFKEVLNNIVKHANAANVNILIESSRNRLFLQIQDDGDGFNNLDKEFREGNGLRNLRMRAQAIGANLKVKSALTEGTTVQLTVPVP